MRKWSVLALLALALGSLAYFAAKPYWRYVTYSVDPTLPLDVSLVSGICHGTPPRLEREFKIGIAKPDGEVDPTAAVRIAYETLMASLDSPRWQVPIQLQQPYRIDREPMVFAARDFYFDTPSGLLANSGASYRLRYRFRNVDDIVRHEANQLDPATFPYRIEVQAKTGRKELGGGKSEVSEARFEWRVESEPFSKDDPPPPPPWLPQDYIPYAQTGRFREYKISAACHLVRSLPTLQKEDREPLLPNVVVVTSRDRMHLDVKTSYGSGPNPEQAFILSFDHSEVFDGEAYVNALRWFGGGKRPKPLARFLELEIEFERNVSTRIDQAVESGSSDAKKLLDAFMADQATILEIVKSGLESHGYVLESKSASKYEQAATLRKARGS